MDVIEGVDVAPIQRHLAKTRRQELGEDAEKLGSNADDVGKEIWVDPDTVKALFVRSVDNMLPDPPVVPLLGYEQIDTLQGYVNDGEKPSRKAPSRGSVHATTIGSASSTIVEDSSSSPTMPTDAAREDDRSVIPQDRETRPTEAPCSHYVETAQAIVFMDQVVHLMARILDAEREGLQVIKDTLATAEAARHQRMYPYPDSFVPYRSHAHRHDKPSDYDVDERSSKFSDRYPDDRRHSVDNCGPRRDYDRYDGRRQEHDDSRRDYEDGKSRYEVCRDWHDRYEPRDTFNSGPDDRRSNRRDDYRGDGWHNDRYDDYYNDRHEGRNYGRWE
ncbi:hypothetical protein SCUCBS95973_003717 [Sporothrix curviconia]|uniref:Uncharacterized protein n=1 Tax=Sporothrix curviconia TaxID=1260050 RepID=A0ABP0BI25_9PEZI